MKQLIQTTTIFFVTVLLYACGAADKAKETADNISSLKNMAEEITKSADANADKAAERRAKGDTLAMPYKELQKFLPEISSYQKDGDPKGESVNMAGMSFSTASQDYKNGEEEIRISISDYNSAYSLFTGVTAMMNAGFSMDNDEETAKGVDLGISNLKGFETIKKKEKSATLVVAAADRFFISIEGDHMENTDKLQSIAKSINLSELASK